MQLWQITIKPDAIVGVDPREFCIQNGVVGIGWRIDGFTPQTKDDYLKRATELGWGLDGRNSWSRASGAIVTKMAVDDLVWTRDRTGLYYIGKIESDWQYNATGAHADADVINFRKCRWQKVGTPDNVPGAVINAFRRGATVQPIHDSVALEYSSFIFHGGVSEERLSKGNCTPADVLCLLNDEDLEDAVAIYLQVSKGYLVFPSTCKRDTVGIECVLAARNGERFGVQVKSGQSSVNRDDFKGFDCTVYVFAACGIYDGRPNDRTICLEPNTIRQFILDNSTIMPGRIRRWIDYSRATTQVSFA